MTRWLNKYGEPCSHLFWGLVLFGLSTRLLASEIRVDSVQSATLNRSWKFHVYLPYAAHSQKNQQTYAVLYCLHGSGGDETDWDRAFPLLDTLIRTGKISPVIAISPGSGTSWWVDGLQPFESAFFKDLVPYVEKKYPVKTEKSARIVTGFSMGGYGALRYALTHPEFFGGAILLSPALYNDQPPLESSARTSGSFGEPFSPELWQKRNYPGILPKYFAAKSPVFFFIAAGDDDWNEPEGVRFNMELQSVLLYQTLHKAHENPAELRIVDGGHNWKLWFPLLKEGLETMAIQLDGFQIKK